MLGRRAGEVSPFARCTVVRAVGSRGASHSVVTARGCGKVALLTCLRRSIPYRSLIVRGSLITSLLRGRRYVQGMERVPEPIAPTLLHWIAYERDAAWTAKLAILRADRLEEIAHFGACLREHERHAEELARLARMIDRNAPVPTDPTFVTEEPHLVGAIDDRATLLAAMEHLEAGRIDRYEGQKPVATGEPANMLSGVLERHLADARARLAGLRRLGVLQRAVAA
jgi:hypothetical protein